jgi:AP-2 complex subunit sigma-1
MAQYRDNKIVYRRYAGLFFSLCVDVSDNELAYLEAIHLLVELLDQFFGNVCELDLVFNFHKVRLLLFVLLSRLVILRRLGPVFQSLSLFV